MTPRGNDPRYRLQLLSGGRLPGSAKAVGNFDAHQSSKRFTHGTMVRPDAVPDAEHETTTMIEYAAHFPQGDQFVRKELQSLLTDSPVLD
jgi:hypothetical protein